MLLQLHQQQPKSLLSTVTVAKQNQSSAKRKKREKNDKNKNGNNNKLQKEEASSQIVSQAVGHVPRHTHTDTHTPLQQKTIQLPTALLNKQATSQPTNINHQPAKRRTHKYKLSKPRPMKQPNKSQLLLFRFLFLFFILRAISLVWFCHYYGRHNFVWSSHFERFLKISST